MKKRGKKSTIDDYLYHIVIGTFLVMVLGVVANHFMKDKRNLKEISVID